MVQNIRLIKICLIYKQIFHSPLTSYDNLMPFENFSLNQFLLQHAQIKMKMDSLRNSRGEYVDIQKVECYMGIHWC